ncbi:nuclear transport factor 2 family protein [Ideonella sp. DXS29W]|uniref:Nuclear transport factor 2 family protein n=1 Tax=Ideonella lacteola TaxID=2984193 RepID=A0ABU9BKE8_9BURK
MTARHPEAHIARAVAYFEQMAPADLDRLGDIYAAQARFKDPFNDVTGLDAVRRIYAHMFEALESPRFAITQVIGAAADAVLIWDMNFSLRGRALTIHGASHLHFDVSGRIALHRDYWDTAEELFAKLPLIGALTRALQRRLATPPGH